MFSFLRKKEQSVNVSDISIDRPSADEVRAALIAESEAGMTNCVTVFQCARILSESVAMLPVRLYDRLDKQKQDVLDHPVAALLQSPNEEQPWFSFIETAVAHLCIRGNFFARKIKVAGEARRLTIISPNDVLEVKRNKGVKEFHINTNGKKEWLTSKDVLHIPFISYDGLLGENPISILKGPIHAVVKGQKLQEYFLDNGAKPSGVITHPTILQGAAFKTWRDKIVKAVSGNKSGSTLFLDGGATWSKISLTPQDIEFLASRKFSRTEIAGVYRVPLHMINDLDKATFSNIDSLDIQFYKHTIAPILGRLEQWLTKELLNESDVLRYKIEFNPDGLLRGDIKSRYDAYALAVMYGFRCPDEIRALDNLPPRPDGKGGQYFYSAQLMPAGEKRENAA